MLGVVLLLVALAQQQPTAGTFAPATPLQTPAYLWWRARHEHASDWRCVCLGGLRGGRNEYPLWSFPTPTQHHCQVQEDNEVRIQLISSTPDGRAVSHCSTHTAACDKKSQDSHQQCPSVSESSSAQQDAGRKERHKHIEAAHMMWWIGDVAAADAAFLAALGWHRHNTTSCSPNSANHTPSDAPKHTPCPTGSGAKSYVTRDGSLRCLISKPLSSDGHTVEEADLKCEYAGFLFEETPHKLNAGPPLSSLFPLSIHSPIHLSNHLCIHRDRGIDRQIDR